MHSSHSGIDFKLQVLQAVDLVELIGRSVALKRRGKDFVGLCPFHTEKTPSFYVSPAKQVFICHGCKAGGTAIDFVMRRDRVEFLDALRLLAEGAGLEMPQFGVSKQKAGERQTLLDMQSAACALFEKWLADPETGKAAREYLASRGFDEASVRRFQIGFAPDSWESLLRSAVGRKFTPAQLLAGGLVKARDNGSGHYDAFRNRLMFPIRDENGRIIAFGGRAMPGSTDLAKYLNSPETPLFSKGRCIFGLDLARQRIVETRTAVIVEGYTDVVMAHQFGVSNVVSVLGTAMTENHVSLLRRFADRIVLLFDADAAGDAAVDKAVALFLTQPIEISIASLPAGADPDEVLLKQGPEAFEQLLGGAVDALTFKWKQLQRHFTESGDSLTGQQQAVERYLEVLASARNDGPVDALRWGAALARVSRLTGIVVDDLNRRFKLRRGSGRPSAAKTADTAADSHPQLTARQRAEQWVLGVLLLEPHRWEKVQHEVGPADFEDSAMRRIAEIYWARQRDEGEPVLSEFLGLLQDPALLELAMTCVDEVEALPEHALTLADGVAHLVRLRVESESAGKTIAPLERTTAEAMSEQEEILLFERLQAKALRTDLRRV